MRCGQYAAQRLAAISKLLKSESIEMKSQYVMKSDSSRLPLVSVIVPTYNYGHFIHQTLESLQAQTYQHWECIVVDDGSTDNTQDVVARYVEKDDRIRYIHQRNLRAAAARNNGIRTSAGKYLQFLDADDLLAPEKLERQVDYLEQHPDVDIVYGNVRHFSAESGTVCPTPVSEHEVAWMPKLSGRGSDVLMALIRLPLVIHAPLVRSHEGDVIYLNERLRACDDWLFWVDCALRGRRFEYENIPGTLAYYRTHARSQCADHPLIDRETRRLRKELNKILNQPKARQLNRKLAAEYEGALGVKEVTAGNLGRGIWQLMKAGMMSRKLREMMKWFFCAAAAPFTPQRQFEQVVTLPSGQTVMSLLRHHIRRES